MSLMGFGLYTVKDRKKARTARLCALFIVTAFLLSFTLSTAHAVVLDEEEDKEAAQHIPKDAISIFKDAASPRSMYKEGVVLKEGEDKETPLYAPGEVIIKLKAKRGQEALLAAKAYSERAHEDIDTLSMLKSKYNLHSEEPLFKGLHSQLKAHNLSVEQLEARNEAKLQEKTIRPPQGAKGPDLLPIYILKTDEDVLAACAKLKEDPNVEYAEPNYVVKVQMVPNDPYYFSQGSWGQPYDDLWGIKKIQCEQAWDISQGEGVVVAVIDTGVDYNHPDLAQNIWVNPGEISANGIDDDNNGYIDDVRGWDFTYKDNNPMDGHGHGTHVSGTIAAVGNNNMGVIGVAPHAKIMPVKGLNNSGSGTYANLAECIKYAADNGARVLSNSWVHSKRRLSAQILEDAIDYAHSHNCVIVFSAGNNNDDVTYYSPANYSKVITVASSDQNDEKSLFSNYGEKIDVTAPGGYSRGWEKKEDINTKCGYYFQTPWRNNFCEWYNFDELRRDRTIRYSLFVAKGPDEGTIDISVDQGPYYSVDLYAPSMMWGVEIPLGNNLNSVRIVVTGEKNPLSNNTNAIIEAAMQLFIGENSYRCEWMRFSTSGDFHIDRNILSLRSNNNGNPTDMYGDSISIVGDVYYRARGTSMACPHVAGLAALILSAHPDFSNDQVRNAIRMSTDDVGTPGWDIKSGYGRINAYKGVQLHSVCIAKIESISMQTGSACIVEATFTAKGPDLQRYVLEYSSDDNPYGWRIIDESTSTPAERKKVIFKLPTGSGRVTLRLQAINSYNEKSEDRTTMKYSTVHIDYPVDGGAITNAIINVWGTAGGDDFLEYTLECAPLGIINMSTAEVDNGILGTLDGSLLEEGKTYTLTLRVKTKNGEEKITKTEFSIIKGMLPGWPVYAKYEYLDKIFSPPVRFSPSIGDLDNDGFLETVFTTCLDDAIGSIYNICVIDVVNHDGTHRLGWPKYISDSIDGREIILADLDNDNKLEIIALSSSNIYIWKENGDVFSSAWPKTYEGRGDSDRGLRVVDLDKDGDLDIVFSVGLYGIPTAARIYAFNREGDNLPGWPVTILPRGSPYLTVQSECVIGDVLGDSSKEIIFGTYEKQARLLVFNHTGQMIVEKILPSIICLATPILGDIDKNGKKEIVVAGTDFSGVKRLYVFKDDGSSNLNELWSTSIRSSLPTISLVDFEKDGFLEIVVDGNQSPFVEIYDYRGNLVWSKTLNGEYYIDQGTVSGDINGDGLSEIISTNLRRPTSPQYYYSVELSAWNKSGGRLEGYPKLINSYDFGSFLCGSASIVDINNDKKIDIVVPTSSNSIYAYSIDSLYSKRNIDWPVYGHDAQHTNTYMLPTNNPPILDPIGDKTIDEGKDLIFTVSATDPDGDTLYFGTDNLPQNATFNNQTFHWIPTYDQAGEYEVTFTVTDGTESDSETITITVNNVDVISIELEGISIWELNKVHMGELRRNVNATGKPMHAVKNTGNVPVHVEIKYGPLTYGPWQRTKIKPGMKQGVDTFITKVGNDVLPPAKGVRVGRIEFGEAAPLSLTYGAPTKVSGGTEGHNVTYELRAYKAAE